MSSSGSGSLPFFPHASSTVSGDFVPQLTFWTQRLCCCSWPSSLRGSHTLLRAPAMGMCQGVHTEDESGRLRCGQPRHCFPTNIRLNTWMAAVARVTAEGLYRASLALLLRNFCLIPNLNWFTGILYPLIFKQALSYSLSDHFPGFHSWGTNEEPSSFLICLYLLHATRPVSMSLLLSERLSVPVLILSALILPECAWLLEFIGAWGTARQTNLLIITVIRVEIFTAPSWMCLSHLAGPLKVISVLALSFSLFVCFLNQLSEMVEKGKEEKEKGKKKEGRAKERNSFC